MTDPKPPISVTLAWQGAKRFSAGSGPTTVVLDGDGQAGPSPMLALAASLAGCMAIDVVLILTKARVPPTALDARLIAHRAPAVPARFERFELHFTVTGEASEEQVSRAVALSRERYCSVWHTLRQDIAFETTVEVVPGPEGSQGAG